MTLTTRPASVSFRESGNGGDWLPAHIPGSVHLDLMTGGVIPDPFAADNELHVQWVAERDWEYQAAFHVTPALMQADRIDLVCDGLDTLAEVVINGKLLGRTENMFRQFRWDVTSMLAPGANCVHVSFPSIIKEMQQRQAADPLVGVSQGIPGAAHVRKAPCQFGWDWGPQLPPVGFWKEMRLEGYHTARLENVHVRQKHQNGAVTVSAAVELERWSAADVQVDLTLSGPDGKQQQTSLVLCGDRVRGALEIAVNDPQLWWPNGLGAQPLYGVTVSLSAGDTVCDERRYRLGLRTLELRRKPDAYGESFTFVVNGLPIFAKGANWIPADSFPTRLSDAHMEHLIRSSVDANMNMLRIWGGGFYEEDRFYDLCDRYGILVWQDFIFSCSVYPGSQAFVDNVRVEAIENIRRLRHHASLALWCGNNEMEAGWVHWGWGNRIEERHKTAYDEMFHHMLPALVAAEDPDRAYWPSSPSSGVPFEDPGGVRAGDTHNWEVWHGGRPFEHYRNHPSRFVSEFGFQSLPALDTVRTYADEADWNMTSYMMEHHQRNASGNGKIINYMTAHFRMPKDFPSLVYLTQLLQAEAVRTGVEFWRRSRDCTSGALYWQLNDCWPVASWASLDYFGRWKVLHYAARRFFAPVLLTAEMHEGDTASAMTTHQTGYLFQPKPGPYVALYVTNDLPQSWQGSAVWSLETLEGEVVASGETAVAVDGLSACKVADLDFSSYINRDNERKVVLVYELRRDGGRISSGVLPFIPSKHLELRDPELRTQVQPVDGGFAIEVSAERLARFVWLELEGTSDPTWTFSDNAFDLPAKRTVTVTLPWRDGWTAERIAGALRVRSLADSY